MHHTEPEIREVRPDEHVAAGRLVVEAYRSLGVDQGSYEEQLADVAGRVGAGTVLVAVVDGALAGCATFAGPGSELNEVDDPEGAAIRMLGVDVAYRGRGIGEALVRACVALAEGVGARRVWLHTEPEMTAAHRLYERVGFVRAIHEDMHFEWEGSAVVLWCYVLELRSG